MRINARLDKDLARKFEQILEETRESKTEALKRAIDAYHREVTSRSAADAARRLRQSGFIGCGSGPATLSKDYKKILARHLRRKA